MNTLQLAGHLGNDPEIRFTADGKKVINLRLATKSRKKGGQEETIWWRITIWGEQFDRMMPHLKKGSALIVIGELQKPELYQDKEGKTQISLSVTAYQLMFSPFGRTDRPEGDASNAAPVGFDQGDDELPF